MKELTLNINLNQKTREALIKGNFNLTIYKGAKSEGANILSTVWFSQPAKDMFEVSEYIWSNSYSAFISNSAADSGIKIKTNTSRGIELGERFLINNGNVSIDSEGKENKLSFHNEGNSVTCGLSMKLNNDKSEKFKPICAAEIPGNSDMTLIPKEKLLVAFTSDGNIKESVAIAEIITSAATVEYFENITEHSITFDFNTGRWKEDETDTDDTDGWFSFVKKGVSIVNDLIND